MGIAIQNIETELIKEWGFVEPGSFLIPEGYREISIVSPPEQGQMEPTGFDIASQMEMFFFTVLAENAEIITPEQEAAMFVLKASLIEMLKFNRYAAARAAITAFNDFPAELSSAKSSLVAILPT